MSKVMISDRALKSAEVEPIVKKIQDLKEEIKGSEVEVILLAGLKSEFSPINTRIKAILDLESLYTQRDFGRNPKLAEEYSKIMSTLNEAVSLIKKRREAVWGSKNKKDSPKETKKGEEK